MCLYNMQNRLMYIFRVVKFVIRQRIFYNNIIISYIEIALYSNISARIALGRHASNGSRKGTDGAVLQPAAVSVSFPRGVAFENNIIINWYIERITKNKIVPDYRSYYVMICYIIIRYAVAGIIFIFCFTDTHNIIINNNNNHNHNYTSAAAVYTI